MWFAHWLRSWFISTRSPFFASVWLWHLPRLFALFLLPHAYIHGGPPGTLFPSVFLCTWWKMSEKVEVERGVERQISNINYLGAAKIVKNGIKVLFKTKIMLLTSTLFARQHFKSRLKLLLSPACFINFLIQNFSDLYIVRRRNNSSVVTNTYQKKHEGWEKIRVPSKLIICLSIVYSVREKIPISLLV